jgi:hypothetical protein
VISGLSIRDHLDVHGVAGEASSGVEATVRMGLHTGIINLQSEREPNAWTPLVSSEIADRAMWLHDQAEGGAFLCSQSALPELQAIVEYADYDAMPMPGQTQPMLAYRIGGRTPSIDVDVTPLRRFWDGSEDPGG